jgi:hypothetical protein
MDEKSLKLYIKNALYLFNNGSTNAEYLRGQVELAMYLLGATADDEKLLAELHSYTENDKQPEEGHMKATLDNLPILVDEIRIASEHNNTPYGEGYYDGLCIALSILEGLGLED